VSTPWKITRLPLGSPNEPRFLLTIEASAGRWNNHHANLFAAHFCVRCERLRRLENVLVMNRAAMSRVARAFGINAQTILFS
jgi:Zn-dependent peptidase ImmA (M78 family)